MMLVIAEASADEYSQNQSKLFRYKYQNAIVHCLKNGQHYLPLTNTDELSVLLKKFLK